MNYDKVKRMVECEIDKIASQPELNDTTLLQLDKLIDILKDMGEFASEPMMIEDDVKRSSHGYYVSQAPDYYYGRSRMYDNGRGSDYSRSYGSGRSMTGSHEDLMRHLEAAMDTAQNDRERTAINELMDKMKMM